MNPISRGIRNAFRNATRTIAIVFTLGLTMGLSLVMLLAYQAVDSKIQETLGSIGNTVTIRPAGFSGSSSVNNALTEDDLSKIKSLPHIKSIAQIISGHAQTEGTTNDLQNGAATSGPAANNTAKTSLKSPYKLDCNEGNCSGGGVSVQNSSGGTGSNPKVPENFSLPIGFIGTNDPTNPSSITATSLKIRSGTAIDGSKDRNEAMVSSAMAKANNLRVGSTFTAFGVTLRVAAIFESNTQAANSTVIVALPTLQRLTDQKGIVTNAIATVDSLDNLESATAAIKKALGSSADVTSSLEEAQQAINPLNSVKNISLYSLLGSVVASSIIVLLTTLMVIRERKREIGILKAIGSSNMRIISQFMCEALTLTILGVAVGLAIGILAAEPVTATLVNNSNSGPGGAVPAGGVASFSAPGSEVLKSVQATVGWTIIFYGLSGAVLIALIGSILAASLIAKVRPSEVLRSE